MGNEKSALSGLELDEKAIEVTDFWMHYGASIQGTNPQRISVFISEPSLHYTASFGRPSPLERTAKNLMLHRHPCILKYMSSWYKNGKFYLATEEVRPLVQVIKSQTTLQICIGLYSVLRALIFLHEKALASHNNLCSSSIYITPEGCWKLDGLEYLCRFTDLKPSYFQKIKSYRYERAISPNEDVTALITSANPTAIDSYAFGILAEDILKLKNAEDVPGLAEFKEFCKENLQNPESSLRNKLSSVVQHPFFTHDFLKIHAFLEELPLRNDVEKEEFFTNLVKQLRSFPEHIVAEQLSRLLLSRLVLLDTTAQTKLLPYVLTPRDEMDDVTGNLFSVSTFKTYLVPKLLQIFCIRDASIRLLLLSHFNSFVHAFQTEELKCHVLPELLVGIKDTDDYLVCATLRALADIVPILGAATVIGGNRGKLFTDGRPNKVKENRETTDITNTFRSVTDLNVPINTNITDIHLPERPSPDGGEDGRETKHIFVEEESAWSDWDAQETNAETQRQTPQLVQEIQEPPTKTESNECSLAKPDSPSSSRKTTETRYIKKLVISDITELDIKHSKSMKSAKEEFDFFTDMEPVIKKPQVLHVEETESTPKSIFDVKLSNTALEESEDIDGWGEDLNDWGADDS